MLRCQCVITDDYVVHSLVAAAFVAEIEGRYLGAALSRSLSLTCSAN